MLVGAAHYSTWDHGYPCQIWHSCAFKYSFPTALPHPKQLYLKASPLPLQTPTPTKASSASNHQIQDGRYPVHSQAETRPTHTPFTQASSASALTPRQKRTLVKLRLAALDTRVRRVPLFLILEPDLLCGRRQRGGGEDACVSAGPRGRVSAVQHVQQKTNEHGPGHGGNDSPPLVQMLVSGESE